jgi:hypothetical protein
LKEALKTAMLYSDLNDDAVIEEMDEILAVLRKKAPFPHPHTTEEMWAEFQAEHADELAALGVRKNVDTEEVIAKEPETSGSVVRMISESVEKRPRRKRGFLRVAMTAAAMIVIIVAATLTASAFGYDLWGWVPKWNSELLGFGEDSSKPNDLHISSPIVVALEQLRITEQLFPQWIPEEFELEASVIQTDPIFFHEGYSNGDRYLSITIEPALSAQTYAYQKEDSLPLEYISNNITHYIIFDIDQYTAIWQTDSYCVCIMGNITLDEMKQIINSIYEVEK